VEINRFKEFKSVFQKNFGFPLTGDQQRLLNILENFITSESKDPLLIVRGYAGTGKTSMLGSFVKTIQEFKLKSRLLAPTGRAAKVLSQRSGKDAFTIHKQIYRRENGSDDFSALGLIPNLFTNTIFIVDEASMIGEHSLQADGSVSRDLMSDLMEYVYSGKNCKLILIGDEGQLPPVGSDDSPALMDEYLKNHFPRLTVGSSDLNEVLRQESSSGILVNATRLRDTDPQRKFSFDFSFSDFVDLKGDQLQEELESAYSRFGEDQVLVITRSNKRANLFNQSVRGRILWFEEQLCYGDRMMVVKNNYYWLSEDSSAGFIANGEMLRIQRIVKYEEQYGFDFARVIVSMLDYPDQAEFEVLLLLEALHTERPSVPRDRMRELFFAVEKDYMHEKNKRKRFELVLKDPYLNALQVKYAYAVTCHKAQGGQWSAVFIDLGYLPPDSDRKDLFRWLYTAVTRAAEKVYLLNFPQSI